MHYKKSTKRVDQIGRELGVSYLLEGSVRRDGDRVRIAAQLIRVSDQTHLWADSYDREIRDILALQSDVARAIAEKIRLTLTPETINRLGSTRPVQPEAYKAYLRARYHLYKWDSEGVSKAIGFSRQAIDFDPTYAPAYALLSEAYSQAAFFSMRSSDAGYSEARAAALRALELDPALAAAHSAAGVVNFYAWDWSGAEREYTRALDLDPNNVDALENYAYFQATMGRPREAIALMKTAVSLDPLTATNRIQLAWNYYAARLYDESISEYAKVIAQDKSLEHMRYMIAVNYAKKGMCAEAVAQCKDLSLTPEKVLAIANLGWVFGVCGRRDDALKYLALLDEDASQRRIDPTIRALISTGLGDKERAFGYLNEAYEQRSSWLHCLKSLPTFDELRSDPRRQSLLDRMRLPR
jgi:tetratricopeptide (TPR) repeat protein